MNKNKNLKSISGLSEKEVKEKLGKEGYNELPAGKKRGILRIALDVLEEPMFLLLVGCGAIYLILGDVQEAVMLLFFVFVVMGITLYQEQKSERALEALKDLSSPRALVIRDGVQKRIAGREVVCGDILVLSEGDRVPADAVLLSSSNILVDESLLTGESVSVRKTARPADGEIARPGGDDLPFLYSSTLVVQGYGMARVIAIGSNTEIGKIGKAIQMLEPEATVLQKETGVLVKKLLILGMCLCTIVVVVYGLTRGNWLHGFLSGITLAMAIFPEEFPVVLTIFLALGAWRIAQKHVLTRRMPAVETLGSATVLCVDKTGTLTRNQMTVQKMFARDKWLDLQPDTPQRLPETFHELLEFSILACQIDPFDPMDKAIKKIGKDFLSTTEHLHRDWSLVQEYPLSRELLALSHVWQSPDGADYVIAAKGAPEAIADLCHFNRRRMNDLSERIRSMAVEGLRILGVAKARFNRSALPGIQHDFDFQWLGLLGLADPVRPSVSQSVDMCRQAGIRVVMITGDYPGTAQNIAHQIGLTPSDQIITGQELDALSAEALRAKIRDTRIFARVVPEQKLRIVEALKANGEIVAMTGDGVNDAPALKSAHIGIAMGGRGTDVARESSALVLLDDDFSSIVQAIKLGRRIFDNIKKAVSYIMAIHVPIAGISLIPVLFKWPLILMPVHIVFLELIIDPACSVVFEGEPEESGIMKRPPRNPEEPLFSRRTLVLSLLQGLIVLVMTLAVFAASYFRGMGEAQARSLTFTTLIVANLGLILTNRSWSRTIFQTIKSSNAAVWWVLGGAMVFMGLVLYIPFLRGLFKFSLLHCTDIVICLIAGTISILWFEGLKLLNHPRASSTD